MHSAGAVSKPSCVGIVGQLAVAQRAAGEEAVRLGVVHRERLGREAVAVDAAPA